SHYHADLRSFPTRRSSDLWAVVRCGASSGYGERVPYPGKVGGMIRAVGWPAYRPRVRISAGRSRAKLIARSRSGLFANNPDLERSEEHTSELQSRGHLVCR